MTSSTYNHFIFKLTFLSNKGENAKHQFFKWRIGGLLLKNWPYLTEKNSALRNEIKDFQWVSERNNRVL